MSGQKIRMPFGKHYGELIEDLPTGYIAWCLEHVKKLAPEIQREMEAQLELRQGRGVVRRREDAC